MDRLDYYDIMPKGMDAYLSKYGFHFSKPLYEWAVSMMRDREGRKLARKEASEVHGLLSANGIELSNNKGYDAPYVWMMAMADYWGSAIEDEQHLARFVKNYLDDPDGSPSRAFDEFYIKTVALGIPIIWEDVI